MEEQNPQGMGALVPQNPETTPETHRLPGPVFEPGPGWGAKLKRNFTKRILPLIVIAVVVVGVVLVLKNNQEEKLPTREAAEETQKTAENIEVKEIVTQEGQTENIYKVTTQRGEGITHLARRALKEYLNANPSAGSELAAEHKIYIEDYLKDLNGEKLLEIGEEIEFSASEITNAIELAKGLSDNQLSNLSQYVPLVSGL